MRPDFVAWAQGIDGTRGIAGTGRRIVVPNVGDKLIEREVPVAKFERVGRAVREDDVQDLRLAGGFEAFADRRLDSGIELSLVERLVGAHGDFTPVTFRYLSLGHVVLGDGEGVRSTGVEDDEHALVQRGLAADWLL